MARHPVFKLCVAYFGACFTVVVVAQMVKFLSYLPSDQAETNTSKSWSELALICLLNISFLCCFFFVHTVLADKSVKKYFEECGLKDVQRSIYVILSCAALQTLFYYWKPMPWYVLWNININDNWFLWLMYTILHVYVWILIYASNLLLDVPELLGIKQVVYASENYSPPESYKSPSLLRFASNMNHTSFLGFSILFWVYPYMRLDRVIFALFFQLYMIINWKPDAQDLHYIRRQIDIKSSNCK